MAGSFGQRIKSRLGDKLKDYSPEEIDSQAEQALSTPEGTARLAKRVREWTGAGADYSDDDIIGQVRTALPRRAPTPAATAPAPQAGPSITREQAQRMGASSDMKASRASFNSMLRKENTLSNTQQSTEETDKNVELNNRSAIPATSIDRSGPAPTAKRFGNVDTWDELKARRAEIDPSGEETEIIQTFGGQPQVIRKSDKSVVASLDKLASNDSRDINQGLATTLLDTLTGNSSALQQAPVSIVRALATGDSSKLGLKTGYGLTEGGADVGEKLGEKARFGFGAKSATAAQLASRLMQGVDMAQAGAWRYLEGVGNELGSERVENIGRELKESNFKEIEQANKDFEGIEEFKDYLKGVKDPQQQAEIDALGGKYAGRAIGAALPAALDTTLGVVRGIGTTGKAVAGLGKASRALNASELSLVPAAYRALRPGGALRGSMPTYARGADALADGTSKAASAVGDAASQIPGVSKAFGISARGGLERVADMPGGVSAKDHYDHAAYLQRNAADNEVAVLGKQIADEENTVLAKYGVELGDPRATALRKSVQEKWSTEAGRNSMDEVEAELAGVLQPYHERVFRLQQGTGAIPKELPYNPLHPLYGQNSAARHMVGETWNAEQASKNGNVNWTATNIDSAKASGLPGVRNLDQETKQKMRASSMRSLDEIAAMQEARWAAGGQMTPREISSAADKLRNSTTADGITSALGDLLSNQQYGKRAAFDYLEPHIKWRMTNDESWMPLQVAQGRAGVISDSGQVAGTHVKNARGFDVADDITAHDSNLDQFLRENDLVLVRKANDESEMMLQNPEALAAINKKSNGKIITDPQLAYLDGMVIPRKHWRVIEEMQTGNSQMSGAYAAARFVDKFLGTSQGKAIITQGNPGFHLRNDVDSSWRAKMEEPDAFGNELVADVKRASNAPLGGTRSVEDMDAGSMGRMNISDFNEVVRKELIGKTRHAQEEFSERMGGQIGSQALSMGTHWLQKKTGQLPTLSKAASRIEQGRDWLINKSMLPAKKIGAQTRHMFDDFTLKGSGASLAPDLSYEEGLKIATFLSKLRRGVPKEKALKDTRELFIDYADKSPFEVVMGGTGLIPFIRYYGGMMKGGLKIALQHPDRFTNTARYARMLESYDQGKHDGAYDQRLKPMSDVIQGNPMIEMDGKPTTVQFGSALKEFGPLAAGMAGEDERDGALGLANLLGPAYTRPYELATGKSPLTGRSVLGLSADQLKRSDGGLWDQASMAEEDDLKDGTHARLGGDSALSRVAWELSRGYLPEPIQAAGRIGLDLGASPAAATPEDTAGATQRTALRQLTGLGTRRINVLREQSNQSRKGDERLPVSNQKILLKEAKKGRGRWGI